MPDTSIPVPAGFSEMSKSEQIRYLQALWDQIAASPAELPVPESHLATFRCKIAASDPDYKGNPSLAFPPIEPFQTKSDAFFS